MLRKLIIAVFVLGFTLTLSGTALSDQLTNEGQPRSVENPNAPRFLDKPINDVAFHTGQLLPSQRPDESQERSVSPFTVTPQPPAAGCGYVWYHNGTATNFFMDPDYLGAPFNVVLNNVRFSVPEPQPGDGLGAIEDTVKGASLLTADPFGLVVGDPGVRLYLYDDDGFGFPGNKLDSVDVDYATYSANAGWADGTFPNAWVFVDGEEYHIAFSVIQNSADDSLAFLTDNSTGHESVSPSRNQAYLAGTGYNFWIDFANLWVSGDLGIILESYVCRAEIPYSDCATQEWYGSPFYVWSLPQATYGDEEYACRFDNVGQDTVVSVSFAISDLTGAVAPPYVFGDDDITVTLYGDDGGLPDETDVLFQTTITGGTYPAYPAFITVPVNIVVNESFHMALFNASEPAFSGDYEYVRGDDGAGDAMDHTSSDWGGGFWVSMLNGWGGDYGFFYEAFICRDEFNECQAINYPEGNFDVVYPVPDANPLTQWGQLYSGVTGLACQLRDIEIGYYRSPTFDSGRPLMFTHPTTIKVMTNNSGEPGTVIHSFDHTTTDYANAGYTGSSFYGAFNVKTDLVPAVNPPAEFFVVVEPQAATRAEGIRLQQYWGDGTPYGAPLNGLVSYFGVEPGGAWLAMPIFAGTFGTESLNATVTVCCIPIPRRPCAPGEDWFTLGHDFQRTYASENALGDAWCDLTVNWAYEDPTAGVAFTGPTVYDDKVICAFGDHYIQFDLATGAQNWTVGPIASLIGAGLRCAPTIVESVDLGATVAFVSGGDQLSIAALDWATGAVLTQRDFVQDITDYGTNYGQTRWGNMMLVDNGGEMLVWTTDDGWVRAATLTAPQMTIQWQTQIGPTFESGATDGTHLYYCTWPAAGDGDIYKMDLAGNVVNTLSGGGGLQGSVVYTLNAGATETFKAGVSLYGGKLYTLSDLAVGGSPGAPFPADGLLYQIDPSTMGVDYAVAATAQVRYGALVHDIGRIYAPGLSHWLAPANGELAAHTRSTGLPVWGFSWPDGAGYYVDGVLSCEGEGFDDLLFVQAQNGFIGCFNSRTGEKIFHRRFDRSALLGGNGAMAVDDLTGDVHLVFASQWGDLVDFTQSADRPRLQMTTYNFQQPVEFGASASLPVTLGPSVINTGCADLNITDLLFDDAPTGTTIPSWSAKTVSDDMLTTSSNIADILTTDANKFKPFVADPVPADDMINARDYNTSREIGNRAAAAFPGVLNFPGYHGTSPVPGVVAAGDTVEIILDVNQALVARGPNPFYMTLVSDDHDYFSQDGSVGTLGLTDGTPPEVSVVLVGGCLTDTTDLHFGIGGANFQVVTNSGRVADNNWSPRYGFETDGAGDGLWQAGYIFGVSQHRIALNLDYTGGNEWISWQPDPNWCDNECKPALEENVNLGAISTDNGATYTPIIGNRVCASGIDSVQNFGDGLGGWDWEFGDNPAAAPFDPDSTMGLSVNSRTIGALDVAELNNVTVEVFEFTERNGNDIPDWKFMFWADTDAGAIEGSADTMLINRDYSVLWDTSPEDPGPMYGLIKIPYGCVANHDGTPLKNVVTLDSDNSMYAAGSTYLDSAYYYGTQAPGAYSMPGAIAARDQSMHATLVEHDITGNETFTFGIGLFGFRDPLIADNLNEDNAEVTGLADIVNKWAGFGRGDVNNDQAVNLADIIYLADYVNATGNGPYPFEHLGDLDADSDVDADDVQYLIDYYFCQGACPMGAWMF